MKRVYRGFLMMGTAETRTPHPSKVTMGSSASRLLYSRLNP